MLEEELEKTINNGLDVAISKTFLYKEFCNRQCCEAFCKTITKVWIKPLSFQQDEAISYTTGVSKIP